MKSTGLADAFEPPSDGSIQTVILKDPDGQLVTYLPGYGDYNDLYAGDDLAWLVSRGYRLCSDDEPLLADPFIELMGPRCHPVQR